MLKQTIFLFDIDGVLVEPRGYRAAVQAALQHFTHRLGIDSAHLPGEAEISLFEANRITSEWDMTPLALAALFDALLAVDPLISIPKRLADLDGWQPRRFPSRLTYRPVIQAMAATLKAGVYPAESVLAAVQSGESNLLPHLGRQPLLADLLSHTRDVSRSLSTRVFQHYSLGSEIFQQVYRLPPSFESDSLLRMLDRPQLMPEQRQRLLARQAAGELALAAYTMRPSLPPRQVSTSAHGYAPEAELALEIVGLQDVPLIGYGRVSYLAELHGQSPEAYLKPSPVQALAATLAALYGEELPALQDGLALHTTGRASSAVQAALGGKETHLHVFEDTPGGVEAVLRAAQVLRDAGFEVQAHAWGIARQEDKVEALNALGAQVMGGIEEAVENALML